MKLIVFCSSIRLIVVGEKNTVYSKFPIPLINRLEKHFLTISTMLSEVQVRLADNLQKWAENFIKTLTLTFKRFLSFLLLQTRLYFEVHFLKIGSIFCVYILLILLFIIISLIIIFILSERIKQITSWKMCSWGTMMIPVLQLYCWSVKNSQMMIYKAQRQR